MDFFLVQKAKKGDRDSFVKLIMENKLLLFKIAKGYLSNDEDIADAIQDTILEVFQHLPELKENRYFKTWMIRILINKCKDIQKKNRKYVTLERGNTITERGEKDLYSFEVQDRFHELLQCLDEPQRTIFTLFYGEELTIKEISLIIGMSENTIKSKLFRGRKKIRVLKKGEQHE